MIHSLDDVDRILDEPGARERQAWFESVTRAAGVPWDALLGEVRERQGLGKWRDFCDAVFLEPAVVLGIEARFWHRWEEKLEAQPVRGFSADFNMFGDYAANHTEAGRRISAALGFEGEARDVSNCLQFEWRCGLFEVTLHSFIPERSRFGRNDLYDRHPDLWRCSRVGLEALLAVRKADDSVQPMAARERFVAKGPEVRSGRSWLYTRIHGAEARAGLKAGEFVVWRDGDRVGVSAQGASIVLPRGRVDRVELTELTPARGGGQAMIRAQTTDGEEVLLLESWTWDGLRRLAEQTANLFGKQLQTASWPDE